MRFVHCLRGIGVALCCLSSGVVAAAAPDNSIDTYSIKTYSIKTDSIKNRVDAIVASYNEPDGPGCALATVQSGDIVYETGFGLASLEHRQPITPATVFYIASTSKQFTAAATALLAEEGKISLDDELRKYVPEIPAYGQRIKIRHLIHHTSGLRDYLGLWHEAGRSYADSISEKAAIDLLARQDALQFVPGAKFEYSNSNYFLLSVIIKRVSGKSLRQYAQERIFAPLGMRDTHFHDDRTMVVPRRASAYFTRKPEEGGGRAVFQTSFDLVGDGGVLTTVRDLALWDRNFYRNVLGTRGQAFIEQLTSTDPFNDGKPSTYAFGLMLKEHRGLRTVAHSGSFIGYTANFMRIPEKRLTVIALCNSAEGPPEKLTARVADAYLNLPELPVRHDAKAFHSTTSYSLAPGYAWSADDQQLLLSSDESGIFNAYALPMTGAAKTALTSSTLDSTYGVSWFPRDARILVRADRGGNELEHLFVAEKGVLRDLTPDNAGMAEFVGWTADGEHFHVVTNERDAKIFDLYRYAASDYTRTLLFEGSATHSIGAVSSDGRYLALMRDHSSANSDIYVLDTQATPATPKLITKHFGAVAHSVFEFTPDGSQLLYASDEHGEFRQAWTYDTRTGAKAPLIKDDWDVTTASFSPSGNYLVWRINKDARAVAHVLDRRSGKEVALPQLPPGEITRMYFSRDEKRLALVLGSDTSPGDIYTVDLVQRNAERRTHALHPTIRESELVTSQVVRFKSYDGLKVPALLYRPATASAALKAPAVVWIHGGPGGQSRPGYSAMFQHLLNHGYAVLAVNNRGSSGYGKTFYHADDKRHGDADLRDVVEAKRYLTSLDWVDREHIGIMGHSYGGYMVGAALAFSPRTFAVGVDIFGVMNWVRTLNSVPPWWEAQKQALYDELGDPATDGERLRRISPLFHAGNIRTPLLVVQGANDPRVLQVESDEIVAAVKANGVPVEYIVFADEGHGFTKRDNTIKASEAYLAFLDRYLRRATPAAAE